VYKGLSIVVVFSTVLVDGEDRGGFGFGIFLLMADGTKDFLYCVFVSSDSVSGGKASKGGGETRSMYFGVKISTSAIKKNARSVFLSMII
jgi:hypothetical protein